MRAFFLGLLPLLTSLYARSQSGNPTDEALAFYSKLKGLTILRAPHLPSSLPASLKPQLPQDTNAAIAFLESELSKQGIELVPHGELFALAVPAGWSNSSIAAKVFQLKRRSMQDSGRAARDEPPPVKSYTIPAIPALNPEELLPEGMIDFLHVDIEQFLQLYRELLNRSLLRPTALSCPEIKFQTQRPMAKRDALYALDTLLVLNGIAAMDDGDKFVQVVPIEQAPTLKFRAPKTEPTELLIDSGHIREFGWLSRATGQSRPESRVSANDLVAYYAELTGRAFVPDDLLGRQRVIFKAQTSLTKTELLYALETTLALNKLAIGSDDATTIRVIRLGDLQESGKGTK